MMDPGSVSAWTYKLCINCSIPLSKTQKDNFLSSNTLMKALFSVFRLNYLNAFEDSLHWNEDEEKRISCNLLCLSCGKFLLTLYHRYLQFLQLGQADSYLQQRLKRLNEIIDAHQQKQINCDLIQVVQKEVEQLHDDDVDNSEFRSPTDDEEEYLKPEITMDIQSDDDDVQVIDKSEAEKSIEVVTIDSEDETPSKPPSRPRLPNIPAKPAKKPLKIFVPKSSSSGTAEGVDPSKFKIFLVRPKDPSQPPTIVCTRKDNIQNIISPPVLPQVSTPAIQNSEPSTTTTESQNGVSNSCYLIKKRRYANPCWYCPLHFSTSEACHDHTKFVHLREFGSSPGIYICHVCSKICPNEPSIRSHSKFCDYVHQNLNSSRILKCPDCPQTFKSKWKKIDHVKTHHNDVRPFPCDQCCHRSKSSKGLKSHKENVHCPDKQKVQCGECKVWVYEYNLKAHKKYRHNPEGISKYKTCIENSKMRAKKKRTEVPKLSTVCSHCNVHFYSRLFLINHRKSVHSDNMGRNCVCKECGRGFVSSDRLDRHIKIVHAEERTWICDVCGQDFKSKTYLSAHMSRSHTKEARLKNNQATR